MTLIEMSSFPRDPSIRRFPRPSSFRAACSTFELAPLGRRSGPTRQLSGIVIASLPRRVLVIGTSLSGCADITLSNIGRMAKAVKEKRAPSPRGGTKKMPRAQREAQLLDLAERAFAERGFQAVSMDDIAAAAGVTKPLIYSYFGSKEGLYLAGIRRAYEDCVERVEEAVKGVDEPAEMLT